jgi:HSP20 family protein
LSWLGGAAGAAAESCPQAGDEGVEAGGEPLVAVVGPGTCADGGQRGEPAGGQGAQGHGWRPGQQFTSGTTPAAGAPAVDISERKNAYLVAVELPGVKPDDLEITVEDGVLTIQGERHFAHGSAEENMHRTAPWYGAFRRSITLPRHVEADKIEASTQDGVLQILVPKAPDVQAKRIQVRAGQGHTVLTPGNGQGRQLTAKPRPRRPKDPRPGKTTSVLSLMACDGAPLVGGHAGARLGR